MMIQKKPTGQGGLSDSFSYLTTSNLYGPPQLGDIETPILAGAEYNHLPPGGKKAESIMIVPV